MKRALFALLLLAGCGRTPGLVPGRAAILYQSDPSRDDVAIDAGAAGLVIAPVGTRVTVIGAAPQMHGSREPWLRVNVRDGRHSGVVGSVPARFLRPSD